MSWAKGGRLLTERVVNFLTLQELRHELRSANSSTLRAGVRTAYVRVKPHALPLPHGPKTLNDGTGDAVQADLTFEPDLQIPQMAP